MKDIIQSHIMRIVSLCLEVMVAISFIGTAIFCTNYITTSENAADKVADFAKVQIPFGKYDELKPVEADGNLFLAAKKGENVKLINLSDTVVHEFDGFSGIGATRDDLIELKNDKGSSVINYKMAMAGQSIVKGDFDKVKLSKCGVYYIGRTDDWYEVMDIYGNLVYQTTNDIEFLGDGSLASVTDYTQDETQVEIVNFKDNNKKVTLKKNECVESKWGNMYIIQHLYYGEKLMGSHTSDYYYYVADETLNPVLEGKVFGSLDFSEDGDYLYGTIYENVILDDGEEAIKKEKIVEPVVLDLDGNVIYKGSQQEHNVFSDGDLELYSIKSGWLTYGQYEMGVERVYYLDVNSMKNDIEIKPVRANNENEYCCFDTEDGFSLVNIEKSKKVFGIYVTPCMTYESFYESDSEWMQDYKWTFVDGSFNDICGGIFAGAYPSQNGSAVVKIGNMWGCYNIFRHYSIAR